jgi:hypothetical protein
VTACARILVAVKHSPHRRPFVRYVHIGHSSGETGIDHRPGLPGERPDRGQDHPDTGDRLGQRRRIADIDGTHLRCRATVGQNPGEILQRAAAAPGQPDGQAAGSQIGRDEPAAVPRRPQQQHITGHLTITDGTDLGCRRHSTPLKD